MRIRCRHPRVPSILTATAAGGCSVQSGGDSYGLNCTGSEMGNLFYNVLGGTAGTSITTSHNAHYDLFSNIQAVPYYWSATEYASSPTYYAWYFSMDLGSQNPFTLKTAAGYYAWAVHSGDVGAVPVPAAVWLFSGGLLGLIGVAKRTNA